MGSLGARLSGATLSQVAAVSCTPTSVGNRTAIYLRVSKGERHTENQRPDIERVIAMRGPELVAEYEEKASAARVRVPAPAV